METDMISDVNEDELWDLADKFEVKEEKEDRTKCISCGSTNLNNNNATGFIECVDCCTCQGRVMDSKPEWSVYEDGKNEGVARCGHATSFFYPKSSLCSEPVRSNDYMVDILQTWMRMKYDEYSLSMNLAYIAHICSKNYLPPAVIENAKLIYKFVHDTREIFRGAKERDGIFSACVQIGAQLQGYYRSPEEIGLMFGASAKLVTNGRNRLTKILYDNPLINSIPPVVPTDFIKRFCYKLNFNEVQIDEIYNLANNVRKIYLASNHQPMSIAAGCVLIYIHIKKLDIAEETVLDVFNITSATTTKIFNKILPYCDVVIDNEKTEMVMNKMIETNYISVSATLKEEMDENTRKLKEELLEMNKAELVIADEETIMKAMDNAKNAKKMKKREKSKIKN